MLGPVRGVGEGLVAALVFTHIGFLPRVGPQVGLQVLQTGVGLRTALELQGEVETRARFSPHLGLESTSTLRTHGALLLVTAGVLFDVDCMGR